MGSCISREPSLQTDNIDKDSKLLINPDNVFWALVSRDFDKNAKKRVFSLYARFRSRLDKAMQDFRFKIGLNSVYINPTDICNADCPYCYVPASKRKNGKQMSNEQLLYVLEKIDKYFSRQRRKSDAKPIIIYHASEPLLVKDMIFSSISKFSRKFHFGIQTNAILLKKEDIKFLKSYKVSVGISLDSCESEVNNYTRRSLGGGNYAEAVRAIEWFNGYKGLNVIATVTKYNVKGLAKLVHFLHSRKVACLLLNPVRATRKSTLKLRPDEEVLTNHFMEAVKEAVALSKESKRHIVIGNFSNIILAIIAPQARRLMCDISPCGGGRCFFAVTAGGDMIPCGEFIGLREFYGGNIFSSSIKEAMSSESFKKIRARMVEKISECDTCIYRNICGVPCPAEVYSLSRDVNVKSPYCEFYKQIIKYAFNLIIEDKVKYLFHKDAIGDAKYEYKLNIWNR